MIILNNSENLEKLDLSCIVVGNKMGQFSGNCNSLAGSHKTKYMFIIQPSICSYGHLSQKNKNPETTQMFFNR